MPGGCSAGLGRVNAAWLVIYGFCQWQRAGPDHPALCAARESSEPWLTSTEGKALLMEPRALVKTLRLDFSLAAAAESAGECRRGEEGWSSSSVPPQSPGDGATPGRDCQRETQMSTPIPRGD